jgi:dTDP-4-amino-4,6-dideoxygalactose transaminase
VERINVTKTFLPPLEEYQAYVKQIWERDHLTNQGPLLLELERGLMDKLSVTNLQVVTNGTLALQVALKALDIDGGEVITTPFSYVATTSALLWERCRPVFVDIEPETFCIDPAKIEAAITPNTTAIMPVHVFGNACDVEAIGAIARRHNLKVIYDAAHAFGVTHQGKSLLSYGDISICSFHATKLFHTIEGGCLVAADDAVAQKIDLIKRFGHTGDEHFRLGLNAKASEFQAAMGLVNLKYVDAAIAARKAVFAQYNDQLAPKYRRPVVPDEGEYNYAYYPLLLDSEAELQKVTAGLNAANIFPRRYFYPSLNTLPYLEGRQSAPISEDIATRIICLPLYAGLESENIKRICEVLNQ